ncbi:MAG TPA: metallopeptidase family protein, partial [Spirochaetota bacterium]|nr:metallopeptidase family protein [Spirochaetota bacterium]
MHISSEKFDNLVLGTAARIVASLPPDLRAKAEEVIFAVTDRPSPEQLKSVGDEDDTDAGDLLGLYEGISLIDRKIDDMSVLP